MKNLKLLPLVAMISGVLVGCGGGGGGGGGGGTPVATYTWQVVDVYKEERSKVLTGCAIFANMSDGSGDVIASRVANRDYRILFHNSDGSVVIDKTIEGADLPSSGIITFKESDVPDGGYVALEELDGRSIGQRDSYMFGVHKSLLQNMTLAISSPQTNNSCYKGEQEPKDSTKNDAVIAVTANGNPAFFMTSSSESNTKGGTQPVGLSVHSGIPSVEKKLVTAFSQYSNSEANNLTQYAIVPVNAVYDVTNPPTNPPVSILSDNHIVSTGFTATDLNLSNSGVEVVLSGGVYQWQPLFDSSITYSIAKSEVDLSSWSFRLNGTTPDISGSWIYTAQKVADGNDVNISYPNVHDFSTTTIGACGNSYCVNSVGYSPSDFQVQRTAIRSKTDADRDFFQTVYSIPSRSQVILKSPSEQIVPKATDRVEIQVVDSNASLRDKAKFTMALGMNLQNLGTDTTFKDFNGVVMLPSEQLKYKKLMMSQNYQALSNKVN
ncbi:hypothetical protein BOO91_09290 [Vibrio navarrensis]|uniref:54K polar flagellar sheath protein A n=1 Tax=Vibrio navarrensis TaxID=29495 RepID=A0AAJ4ID08_9VIBR|nr:MULTISPECIES: hypothetical protein [Vibrio]KJR39709.1 hypothetical protein UF06_02180 [Vibrio sp. S234-5]MBE3661128.1 hypothetical protein [Vibrio navarrensis]QPL54496.1 hypothetical protein I3X05_05005 [Vibrio navarrensis]